VIPVLPICYLAAAILLYPIRKIGINAGKRITCVVSATNLIQKIIWTNLIEPDRSSQGATMRDQDVRNALRMLLDEQHGSDPDTTIVEEMGVWSGTARIDVAVINGELTGFELKSERDTLNRLPDQAEVYGLVFDRIFLVTAEKHLQKAKAIIPQWWGALVVRETEAGGYGIKQARKGRRNPAPNPQIIAKLLWKEEALELLALHGFAKGFRSKPVTQIHKQLAVALTLHDLRNGVRAALKRRTEWLGQVRPDPLDVPIDPNSHPCF
jgi:hypothetical protein